MKKQLLAMASLAFALAGFSQAPVTFNYTGAAQTYTVPTCVTSVTIQAYGAQGGNATIGGTGGLGGYATGVLTVTPGDVLTIYVGGQNGYNGGGTGGQDGNTTFGGLPGNLAPSGGGASDVRVGGTALANRVIVAGGGGGGGSNGVWPGCQVAGPAGNGGDGGGLTGSTGGFGVGTPCNCAGGGGDGATGGSQVAGGIHGGYYGNTACLRSSWGPGGDGSLGLGGNGSLQYHNGTGGGGGGGGGYYGGGSGGNGSDTTPGGGGGGGSSYTGTLSSASTTSGGHTGNGMVVITPGTAGTVPSMPTSISGNSAACPGTSLTYSISSVLNATGYTWSVPAGSTITNGQGTTTITITLGTTSGNVSVTADNACGSSTAQTFAVNSYTAPTVTASSTAATICAGTNDTLTANGASTYSWSSGGSSATEIVSPASSTSYTVIGTDANGCSDTTSISIAVNALPTVTATAASPAICNGGSDVLSASGANSYAWSSGGTASTETVSPTTTSTYTVTGTDANGCVSTANVTVTVNALPGVTASASATNLCMGGSDTVTAGGAQNYVWNTSATTAYIIVAPTSNTTYTVTGTDANGCSNTATVTVNVHALPVVNLGNNVTQCSGSVTLDAQNQGSTYLWSNSSTSQTITVSTSGTYSVVVTDGNGCSSSDAVDVTINPLPTLSVQASATTVCLNDGNVTLTGTPSGGSWSGTGVSGNAFSPMTAGNGPHVLTYSYTDGNGCSNTATLTVTVNACVGFNESALFAGVSVFPNPSNGMFTLTVNTEMKELNIEVTDMTGRVLFQSTEKNISSGFTKKINMEEAANGVYLLKLSSGGQQHIGRMAVQH